jgi:glucokinase
MTGQGAERPQARAIGGPGQGAERPQARAIGIDIGGTKLAAGLVGADGAVLRRTRRDTPADDAAAIDDVVAEVVAELAADERLPVGVGAAGLIDGDGVVRYAPNLDWEGYPLQTVLAKRLGVPVTVDNDANTAAWAEYRVGAGREAQMSLVMLTVGTGVGGGLVMGGRLVRGASGLGAELGHLIVLEGGPVCPCGNRGCLEALASGTAIGRTAREHRAAGRLPDGSALLDLDAPDGRAVTAAARDGDAGALAVLAEVGGWLGVGIASLVNALDPEVVVLGGGGMNAGDLLLEPAVAAAHGRIIGLAHRPAPPIVPAELGDDAGLVGAALLALDA